MEGDSEEMYEENKYFEDLTEQLQDAEGMIREGLLKMVNGCIMLEQAESEKMSDDASLAHVNVTAGVSDAAIIAAGAVYDALSSVATAIDAASEAASFATPEADTKAVNSVADAADAAVNAVSAIFGVAAKVLNVAEAHFEVHK